MSYDAGDLPSIQVEPIDDDVEVDPEEVDQAVRRMLTRDEARIMSVVSVVLMAIGVVFSVGWLFVAWRLEHELNGSTSVFGGSSDSDADLVDRIVVLMQAGPILMLSLLAGASGCGLRLFSSRLITEREE
jgi:hypothetical protein